MAPRQSLSGTLKAFAIGTCVANVFFHCYPAPSAYALAQQPVVNPNEIENWIKQLGSTDFNAREKATEQLRSHGPSALPLLRAALNATDAEVRKRAADLVAVLEKLDQTRKALEPLKVTLKLKQASANEALAEFSKASGMRVDFADPRDRVAGKKIDLSLENASVWEALRLIKASFDLRERVDQEVNEEQPDPGMWRRRPGRTSRGFYEVAPFRLNISPRPPEEPAEVEITDLALRMGISPTPSGFKLTLQSQPDARILAVRGFTPKLTDSAGKSLIAWKPLAGEVPIAQQRRGQIILPLSKSVPARQEAHFERTTGGGNSTILSGAAQIDLLQLDKPLVRIDDLAEAEGKSVEGRDGVKLEVKQALEIRPGLFQVRFLVTPNLGQTIPDIAVGNQLPGLPPPLGQPVPGFVPGANGPMLMPTVSAINPSEFRFTLEGRALTPSGTGVSSTINPQGTRHEVTFTFQNRGLDSLDGVAVEWISQNLISLNVPFEFRELQTP